MVVWRKVDNDQEGNLLSDPSVAPTMNDLDGPTTVGSPWSTYLKLVIFLTQAKFLENKIYTEKCVNYDKLHSKFPIFRVKSVKIYTGQINLHGYIRGIRDKYQVCVCTMSFGIFMQSFKRRMVDA